MAMTRFPPAFVHCSRRHWGRRTSPSPLGRGGKDLRRSIRPRLELRCPRPDFRSSRRSRPRDQTSGPNFVNLRELRRTFLVRFVYRNHRLGDVIGVPETVSLARVEGDSSSGYYGGRVDVLPGGARWTPGPAPPPESPRRPACQNQVMNLCQVPRRGGRPLAREPPTARDLRLGLVADGDAAARLASMAPATHSRRRHPDDSPGRPRPRRSRRPTRRRSTEVVASQAPAAGLGLE